MPLYQRGDVRIRYEETGSGFPLLVAPGGGLNSRVSNWPTVTEQIVCYLNGHWCAPDTEAGQSCCDTWYAIYLHVIGLVVPCGSVGSSF